VPHEDYKRSLEFAKAELGQLQMERNTLSEKVTEIDRHIVEVIEGIKGLARLCDQQLSKELLSGKPLPLSGKKGLNDAVRFVLQTSHKPLTPVEVRERLYSLGFDIAKYKTDFLATLHTVLKRLNTRREVDVVQFADGKNAYKWITEADIAEEMARENEGTKD
jgi:hypothetical protein